mmetsp:Transcript_120539/g.312972  ORF Transcript_120539/g.312972 Transcript_120539/m.312972 type:complete len:448 (-) Transcript_120539:68-1411(-)
MQSASRSQLLCIMFPSHARFLLLAYSSLLHSSQGSLSDRSSDDHLAVAEQAQCFPGEGTHMGTTSKDHADGDGDQDPSDVSLLHLSSKVTFRTMKGSFPEQAQVSTSKTEHELEKPPILDAPASSTSQRHAARSRQTSSPAVAKLVASEDTQHVEAFGDHSESSHQSAVVQVSSSPDAQPASPATLSGTSRMRHESPVITSQTGSGNSTAMQRSAMTLSGLSTFMPRPEEAPTVMMQARTRYNRTQPGAWHRLPETFRGLSSHMPRPDEAATIMMQTRTRHNRTQSGASSLARRVVETFTGLASFMPKPEQAPSVMHTMRTKHNKSVVSGPVEQILGTFSESFSNLGSVRRQPEEASRTMLLSRARRARKTRVHDSLLSLNSILTIVLLLALIAFGLLLYHNNGDVQATVQQIRSNPSEALEVAKAEAREVYRKEMAETPKKKAVCC